MENVRVLIIEDNPVDTLCLKDALEESKTTNFVISHVETLAEGKESLANADFDVVVLDLGLPDSEGLETFFRIQNSAPTTSIVVLSGLDDEILAREAVRKGAQDYLLKGKYDGHFLSRSITYAIERKRAQEEIRRLNEDLEIRIKERTHELTTANEKLLLEISNRKRAEESALQSKAKLEAALASMTDAVFISDVEGNFIEFNEAFATFHKFRNKEECPKTLGEYPVFLDVFMANGEHAPLEQWAVPRALSGETAMSVEYTLKRKDTGETWVGSYSFAPIRDQQGKIVGSVVTARDITESKRAEKALRESEHRYRSLFDNMLEGLAHCKMIFRDGKPEDFVYLNVNESFERLTGLTDVVGKKVTEVIPGIRDSNPALFEIYGRVTLSGQPERFETYVEPLGIWFSVSVYSPELRYFVAVFDNITERKHAEEALKKSEQRYRQLHETMRDAFVQVDMSGMIIDFNTAYQDMLGYEPEELRRLTYSEITPSRWHDFEARIVSQEILPLGRSHVYEKEYIHKDGRIFPVELRTSLIADDEGKPSAMWAIVRDVTERKRAEEALAESEKKFRLLYEEAPIPYQSLDEDGRLLEINAAWLGLLGYSRDEVIGKNFADFLTPRSREQFRVTFPAFKRAGQVHGVEHEMVCKDKTIMDVSIDGRISMAEGGKFSRTHCVFQNITERKRAEKALRESEQRYRAIFNIASVGIDLVDDEGRFLEANGTFCQTLGYTQEELRHLTILDVTHPEDVNRSREMHEAMVRGEIDDYRLEKRYMRKDGTIVWSDTAVSTIRDRDARYGATVGVIRDVTQDKKSEEARVRLSAAVEQAAEAVVITDSQGIILYANPAFERTTGYAPAEVLGKSPSILKSGHQDEAFYKNLWDTIRGGKVWTGHFINKKKDGSLFEEDASISPVKAASGEIVNYVAVKRDVTREVSLQKQLLQAQKMEAVGTLAGGVAHDFNNILQVALGYSDLMLTEGELPRKRLADLRKIRESAQRGADLVQRLLTFSRKTEIKLQPLNLNTRITELRKMLERTLPKMIDVQLLLAKDLSRINADPTQVDQVLMNVCVNARDAMPEGGKLLIETANVDLDEEYAMTHLDAHPGSYVLLTITDTGSGIDAETREHIFEPFYTTKGVGEGTGLGLAVVHGIVKHHGGHIRCYSEPAEGTCFKIYFPALISEEEEPQAITMPIPQGGSETILLVDDEDFIRDLGSRILGKAGYKVITASNGKEALEVYQVRGDEISLIILDLIMPEMGGKQFLAEILKIDPFAKVIIASGFSANGPIKDALTVGAKGFVNKPYNIRQMMEVVREVLDQE